MALCCIVFQRLNVLKFSLVQEFVQMFIVWGYTLLKTEWPYKSAAEMQQQLRVRSEDDSSLVLLE